MNADAEWLSISAAAARLTASGDRIERSALSRYLKQHAEALPLRRDGKANLVEFDRLVAHRAENIRIATPARTAEKPPVPDGFSGTQISGSARKALAEAELKELELAQRRGLLVPANEVDQAARDAIALMQSAFDRATEGEAASLSVRYGWDERTIRLALKGFVRSGLDAFHREILKRVEDTANRPDRFSLIDDDHGRNALALQ